MPRALLLALLLLIPIITTGCETCRDACRGPSPASCPAAPALPEPRAEGDGPPPVGRNCAELAGREPSVPPLCGPSERSCAPPCPPPQRVIVEVVHRHEKPPCPPPAPAPMPAQQTLPTMASPTALLPVQPTAAYAVAPAAQRVGLGFALDFFRLPIPFLRPIPVALPAEAPTVMVMQQPQLMQQPPPLMQPPQQFAHVPVSGTALVPVPPGPPSVMASPTALPPAMIGCPPCPPVGAGGPGLPPVSAATLDALTREVDALRRAMEGAKR